MNTLEQAARPWARVPGFTLAHGWFEVATCDGHRGVYDNLRDLDAWVQRHQPAWWCYVLFRRRDGFPVLCWRVRPSFSGSPQYREEWRCGR